VLSQLLKPGNCRGSHIYVLYIISVYKPKRRVFWNILKLKDALEYINQSNFNMENTTPADAEKVNGTTVQKRQELNEE